MVTGFGVRHLCDCDRGVGMLTCLQRMSFHSDLRIVEGGETVLWDGKRDEH